MPKPRIATLRQPRPVLGYRHHRFQLTGRASQWTAFVAALWSAARISYPPRAIRRAALALMLVALPGCSELAQSSETSPPTAQPLYVPLASKYLQSTMKDRAAYDEFEISGLRWVHALKGWSWLACVHFHDQGHLRTYALFIQGDAVVDGRFAVETDTCEAQAYTQFDVVTGVLGRPTAPVQPALY
jgi:hypothetical protein